MDALLRRRAMMAAGGGSPTPPGPTPSPFTPDDYVQNGLISMYDGVWNSGREFHQSSPSIWKDLIGSNDLTITAGVIIGANYLQNTDYSKSIAYKSGVISNALTMEIAFRFDDVNTSATTFILANRIGTRYNGNFFLNYGSFGNMYFESLGTLSNRGGVPFSTSDRNFHTIAAGWSSSNAIPSRGYDNGQNNLVTNLGGSGRDGAGTYFVIGGIYPANTVYGMKGKVYCVRLYNRLLSEQEIIDNYNIDIQRFG